MTYEVQSYPGNRWAVVKVPSGEVVDKWPVRRAAVEDANERNRVEAVDQAIRASRQKIGTNEARLIHRLLRGRGPSYDDYANAADEARKRSKGE